MKYFKTLAKTYQENIINIYPNVKVITRETNISKDKLEDYISDIINEKEIFQRIRTYYK